MHGTRKRQPPSEMHIRRAANGGFVVKHSYDNTGADMSYQPPTEHVFKSHGELAKHVQLHFGGVPPEAPSFLKPAPSHAAGVAASHQRGRGVD